ncbi:hypothetical protein [Shivajiella indica]|uniref:Uncharacterized protein n=1 Tax=Shivajiella indica TaxID=872115 RepID=A0ABW5BAT9_9BACT
MAVNNSLNLKKNQIQVLKAEMIKGFSKFDSDLSNSKPKDWDWVATKYQELKKEYESDSKAIFEETLKKPYQQIKILKAQYNNLINKKPYSFVAKLMGHEPYD